MMYSYRYKIMILDDPDQTTKTKTIYDVSVNELMWRNFLAGISRAFGGMVVYFFVAFIVGHVFLTFIWPVLETSIDTLGETGEILKQMNSFNPNNSLR